MKGCTIEGEIKITFGRSYHITLKYTSDTTFHGFIITLYIFFIAVQNIASEASSQPCQDPALNDDALQEMLEKIDSLELSKYIYNTPRINVFNL